VVQKMPISYQVTSSSDLEETQITSYNELDATQIYIIIVDEEQVMYIWRGSEAPNRMKFVSSRAAAQIRVDRGGTHSVQSIDQGQEPPNFLDLFETISQPARSLIAEDMRGAIKGLNNESMEAVFEEIVDKIPEESSEELDSEMPLAPIEDEEPSRVPGVELPSERTDEEIPGDVAAEDSPTETGIAKDQSQISFDEATQLLASLDFSSSEEPVQMQDSDVELPVPEETPVREAVETLMEGLSEESLERVGIPEEVPEETPLQEAEESLMKELSEEPLERVVAPEEVPAETPVQEAEETLMEEPREEPSARVVITAEVPAEAPVQEAVKTLMGESSEVYREEAKIDLAAIKENLEAALKEFTIPTGYIREFIISKNQIFSIVRKEVQLLGVREERLEPLGDLPDGSHPVKEYLVRLLVKDGNILAVEFLRQHSPETSLKTDDDESEHEVEHERSELLSAMRQEVEELRPKR